MTIKNLPIRYQGELHDIRLINFSIAPEEVLPLLPVNIQPRLFNGRALISMVDVKLRHMHPAFIEKGLHFGYRHMAFRLLVDDSPYAGSYKGIYFLRSFTDKSLIALGGSLFTQYKLSLASIREESGCTVIEQDGRFLEYRLEQGKAVTQPPWLLPAIGALDRAYSVIHDQMYVVQIMREKWPLQATACTHFHTSFFRTARLEGAFRVEEMIPYTWLPAQKIVV